MIDEKKLIEALKNEAIGWGTGRPYKDGVFDGLQLAVLITKDQPQVDVPDTNVGEYIDTGCKVETIHTVAEKKIPKHFKLIKDDDIVKEFILCKNPVGQAGYYETVAGVFYGIDMGENSND